MRFTRLGIAGITIAVFSPFVAFGQTSCPYITRNPSVGSRGSDVIQLQQYLISQNLLASDFATGYFGRLTEAALQKWQSSRGVVSSGTAATTGYGAVGPKTRAALAAATCSGTNATSPTNTNVTTYTPPTFTNSNQSTIDALLAQVKVLQEQLARLIAARSGSSTYNTSSNTPSTTSSASCSWNGSTVAHGSSVTAYQSASVFVGSQCLSETRTCSNGTLSGRYTSASCVVGTAISCMWNNQTVANGSSITAYQSSSVAYGSQCASQTRTCSSGTLSGTYQSASCTVGSATSCTFNGQTVANGTSVTAYQSSSVPFGQQCVSETRTCTNGTLSGSYQYPSCSIASAPAHTYWFAPILGFVAEFQDLFKPDASWQTPPSHIDVFSVATGHTRSVS